MKDKYFIVFSCCVFVNGKKKGLVCDLQRNVFYSVPNTLASFFKNKLNFDIKKIKEKYPIDFDVIYEYFEFLEKNDIGYFSGFENNNLKKIDIDYFYDSRANISNAIIEFNDESFNDKIIKELNNQNCESLEIRFFEIIDPNKLQIISNKFEDSSIISLTLLLQYSDFLTFDFFKGLWQNNTRIKEIFIFSSPTDEIIENKNYYIKYTSEIFTNSKMCGTICKNNFISGLNIFSESKKVNSCLYKKISIDKDGNIKNCPSMSKSFGNIKNTTFEEVLNQPNFKKYWNVTKDMIEACKDCEYRYICTDCRAYTERNHFDGDIDLSKPLKCGYNPYTNEWAEWSANPLKQKVISHYEENN